MSAITGKAYIDRIDKMNNNVWIEGERVENKISDHPAFKGVLATQAILYDTQHQVEHMTYPSPVSGNPVGTSFMPPKTLEQLIQRRKTTQEWARKSGGMMGRSPDYMNTALMAFAASKGLLEGEENAFPENLQSFYEEARENDYSLTHTFITPQVNRSELYFEDSDEVIAAKIVDKNDDGIVIQGARLLATQGGITDEVMVFSAGGCVDPAYAYSFSIPSNTKGLKFICRESFAYKDSSFDYPLSSRFEEMDSIIVFDNVLVPWERVFFYENLELSNKFLMESAFRSFALHQVVSRQIVKIEFVLGIVESIVETINIGEYQHVQAKVAEVIEALEIMKALLTRAEAEAGIDRFGLMSPDIKSLQVANHYFPRIYPRFSEIIQLLGASGMVSIPTEKDFKSKRKKDLELYLQGATKDAEERLKVFRLAWDLSMSAFGTRQTLYERFFFGDPIRLSSALYKSYDKQPYVDWINDFLVEKEDRDQEKN
ncbi:4-hydroxyphenylacetate 3-monooxygenase [Salirhabdus euzebyi]|uniref:4-hydroxyphenylacetate 3-monooxygenase n=1 Tax=Salirhabdus euzebyi TaxID=394506 RepID=A0A841Q592_9BACI|nr:4-hydroxyphenylacetate 3-monooxygenase, oxygenase component [Salirhabdus euzebyi]MBB6453502.1 4-hydroxyphenylacetate 3-monooxygenase [Salirhabdus euzebyi]